MTMSWGRLSTRPLAPEDDWFVEPDVGPSTGLEEPGERRTSDPGPREGASGPPESRGAKGLGGERSRKLVAAAVIGAILFIGGALVGSLAALSRTRSRLRIARAVEDSNESRKSRSSLWTIMTWKLRCLLTVSANNSFMASRFSKLRNAEWPSSRYSLAIV